MNNRFFVFIVIAISSLFLFSSRCSDKQNTQEQQTIKVDLDDSTKELEMLSYKFRGDYTKQWHFVDSLEKLGLYESALKGVKIIFDTARTQNNVPQVVKSVMYKMKYNSYLAEDDYILALNELNILSNTSNFPLKQIIHSVTAEVYWGYYQNNRWKFLNRTQTVGFKNEDIRTWDLNRITDQVIKHYQASLTSKDSLQHAPISDFQSILISYQQDKKQRPTLYDFLAYRALGFFENNEAALSRPADKFTVNNALFFEDASSFAKIQFNSKDSLSGLLHASEIYRELTQYHLQDADKTALIEVELKRLNFARRKSIEEQKEVKYITSLLALKEKFPNNDATSEVIYNIAAYYNEQGEKFGPSNKDVQWDKNRALKFCTEAIDNYPGTLGAQQCIGLKHSIENKSISFITEQSYYPDGKGKFFFNYKNINHVYFKIVPVEWEYFLKSGNYGEDLMKDLLKKKTVKEWDLALNNPGDHQMHSTEIILDELTSGKYVLLASNDKAFRLDTNAIAYSPFWVSSLSYNYRRNDDESYDVFVTDRETGIPANGVIANVYIQKYNYATRHYDLNKQESYRTDAKGMFTIKTKAEYRNLFVEVVKGKDKYVDDAQLYQYRSYKKNHEYNTTHFFTDRAIYRPGQTIYFKGIRIHHNYDDHKIETEKPTTVELYDVNHQKVTDLKLVTNEYGTFSGQFTAPNSGLNGQMYIKDEFGITYFRVEEYKRPKFQVVFEPLKGAYKIGQNIKVIGKATAYAGSAIDGAEVQYRIQRSCYFPSWTWYRWGYQPYSQPVEIKNGTVETDDKGNFIINFDALEDRAINAQYYPNYSYQITADVTDINGETHSNQTNVVVGYNAMFLNFQVNAELEKSGSNKFKISSTNLNGQKLNAKGSIKITKLIEPKQSFRSSLWNRPDLQLISEIDYRKFFPHDAYTDENELRNYKKDKIVFDKSFDTQKEDSIALHNLKSWSTGHYLVEVTAIDSFGVKVSDIKYVTVRDKNAIMSATNDIFSVTPIKTLCEPGEDAEILISSSEKNFKVLFEIEHKGKIIKQEFIDLNGTQHLVKFPIQEVHRGNISFHFTAVRYGRSHISSQVITVPFSNKELDITFETFRDKLKPGQEEEWILNIKGPNGEKIAAEMLATMYDASLDQFAPNSFYLNVYNSFYANRYWNSSAFGQKYSQLYYNYWNYHYSIPYRQYDYLNWWGFNNYNYWDYRGDYYLENEGMIMMDAVMVSEEKEERSFKKSEDRASRAEVTKSATTGYDKDGNLGGSLDETISRETSDGEAFNTLVPGYSVNTQQADGLSDVQARSNFNETAFFMPHLRTNENGDIRISFTIPESLTQWKFIGLAHTKDLKIGMTQKEIVTKKELMVIPNAPRFLREGDQINFSSKISNLSESDLEGEAQLFLFNALTDEPIDALFNNQKAIRNFSVKKDLSTSLSWKLTVPEGIGAVKYKVVAKGNQHSDGEENALPILSNRMLVTESLPLPIKGAGTKNYSFTKLINSGASTSIRHHKLTLEYTSNPAWYAIQAMPYMMEYPYECSEQIFTRYYTNAIASNIVNSSPKIKEVFDTWSTSSPEAFLSNLQKNQELKSLILEETPWVLDAKNESERKKRIALLFDLNKMDRELIKAMRKLQKMQVSNGGWPWFPGMEDNRYITQHIITGMGHLDNLGVKDVRENREVWNMVKDGVNYLDQRIIEDYKWLKKHDPDYLIHQRISQIQVQYLYARSYFTDIPVSKQLKEAFDYYQNQAAKYWKNFGIYNEGMIALSSFRYNNSTLSKQIMSSLKERAIEHDELGMYWKDNVTGYFWYQAPIETQALLIEAFDEITTDTKTVEELKVWLLKQKQTTDWKTTKATAEACYALLLRGTDILEDEDLVEIKINGKVLDPIQMGISVQKGTGYFKTSWNSQEIKPDMGKVSVTRKKPGVSWGAMYWQYFEDLDKITMHETPLKLNKKLFKVVNTESGPVIKPIDDKSILKPGDKVRVRIELRTDRDMEYVHMKDMRAAGMEPTNVISRYKWQDGLGYYESTKDASTNFFFDYLRKGTYVFEYDLFVSHYGNFSNGITTIQCMYAPEFTAHSEGSRIQIKK